MQNDILQMLFVGGSKDGEMLGVRDDLYSFDVVDHQTGKIERYQRTDYYGSEPGQFLPVMAIQGLTRLTILQRLIKHYRAPEN